MASNTKGRSPEGKILSLDNPTKQSFDLIADIFVNAIIEEVENSSPIHQDLSERPVPFLDRRSTDDEPEIRGASWHSDTEDLY